MKKNKKLYIIFMILIIIVTVSQIKKVMQNDTYFTIATGNEIIQNGYDNMDHLTYHENLEFNKLRWGFDVTIATLYNNFGFAGIYVFVIIIASITQLLIFHITSKKTNLTIGFITSILTSVLMSLISVYTGRAQIISYLLLVLTVFTIEKLIETKHKRYYFAIFIISVLIVNFHASVWNMMIILTLPYLAEAIAYKILSKKKINSQKIIITDISIKSLIIAICCMILGSFISPIGGYTYIYMFKVIGGISSQFIQELQITNLTTTFGVSSILIVFLILTFMKKTKIKLSDLLLYVGLFFMALLARRNQPYFYIFGTIVVARIFTSFIKEYEDNNLFNKIDEIIFRKKTMSTIISIVICITVYNMISRIDEEYLDKSIYPVDAVEYIKENLEYENMHVFNGFDFGSYLELNGIRAFVDSRSEIFTKEFNNTQVLEDWLNIEEGKIHYRDIFVKYNINYAILYNDEIINVYISKDEDYEKVYSDNYFSVYVKK